MVGYEQFMICHEHTRGSKNFTQPPNTYKSVGSDDIRIHILKLCTEEMSYPLSIIFNKSVFEGTVSKD